MQENEFCIISLFSQAVETVSLTEQNCLISESQIRLLLRIKRWFCHLTAVPVERGWYILMLADIYHLVIAQVLIPYSTFHRIKITN